MKKSAENSINIFVICTYILFWILFCLAGGSIYLKAPQFIQTIMKYVCAWTSTFVFVILFKKIYPYYSLFEYFKKQFTKVNIIDFAIPMIIQILIMFIAIVCVLKIDNESVKNIKFVDFSEVPRLFIANILYGPMGEELGWRSYALSVLQKKHSPLTASLIIGLLWGFWHFPLWFMSGYSGYALAIYILFFMVSLIELSVFLAFFYDQSKSILVAIWIHFLFNFLLQIAVIDSLKLLGFTSLFYLIAILLIVLFNKDKMLSNQVKTLSVK
jgi:hypothetical protein